MRLTYSQVSSELKYNQRYSLSTNRLTCCSSCCRLVQLAKESTPPAPGARLLHQIPAGARAHLVLGAARGVVNVSADIMLCALVSRARLLHASLACETNAALQWRYHSRTLVELHKLKWLRSSLIDFSHQLSRLLLRGAPVFIIKIQGWVQSLRKSKTFYLAIYPRSISVDLSCFN